MSKNQCLSLQQHAYSLEKQEDILFKARSSLTHLVVWNHWAPWAARQPKNIQRQKSSCCYPVEVAERLCQSLSSSPGSSVLTLLVLLVPQVSFPQQKVCRGVRGPEGCRPVLLIHKHASELPGRLVNAQIAEPRLSEFLRVGPKNVHLTCSQVRLRLLVEGPLWESLTCRDLFLLRAWLTGPHTADTYWGTSRRAFTDHLNKII